MLAWYKTLQEQIGLYSASPQRQMIADVAKTLTGEEGGHLAIKRRPVNKTLSYLIPGIAIARETKKRW